MMRRLEVDVAIVGAGPAGLAAACLLAEARLQVGVIADDREPAGDPRTVALLLPSVRLLRHLGLDPGGPALRGSPLARLKIIDDTGRLFASPPLLFQASEIGEDAFGWNVAIGRLRETLLDRAASLGSLIVRGRAELLRREAGAVVVETRGTTGKALVAIAADGSDSRMRAQAGVGAVAWSYDQTAIATSFSHSVPHHDTSVELHRDGGPLTTVPMPDGRSSLVWMERPDEAARLMTLSDQEFARQLQADLHGLLGLISDVGARRSFPMRGLTAGSFARDRVMLVGEAAHTMPPVGAQGLNLSLRDAATSAELIASAVAQGGDPGAPFVMDAYDRRRRIDVAPRLGVIDFMNRSLLSRSELPHAARSLGMQLASRIGLPRTLMLQTGLGISEGLPVVMRG